MTINNEQLSIDMLPRELFSQVKKIEIKTRRVVDDITAGAYRSVFKGRGIEFDEVREYTADDDVRDIDWNVTARMGSPYIKKYIEERELTVVLAIDSSASGAYGSGAKTKHQCAAEIAALLAFSAIRNNDKVGLIMFTDRTELYLPPKSGKVHGLRLIREILARRPEGTGTDIGGALSRLMNMLHKRAVIFLISDLIDEHDYSKLLMVANRRHDLVAVRILDPFELKWPSSAYMNIMDSESGEAVQFPASGSLCSEFAGSAEGIHEENRKICSKAKIDLIDLKCGEDLVKPLVKFFRQREKFRK